MSHLETTEDPPSPQLQRLSQFPNSYCGLTFVTQASLWPYEVPDKVNTSLELNLLVVVAPSTCFCHFQAFLQIVFGFAREHFLTVTTRPVEPRD
jgi:hypothetical protein